MPDELIDRLFLGLGVMSQALSVYQYPSVLAYLNDTVAVVKNRDERSYI